MPISIIIIDDHPVVRTGIAGMLEGQVDFSVSGEAKTAEAGLELIAKHQPDVVLCDLRLPGMDGLDAIRQIKQDYPDTRVLVLTSYNTAYDIHAAMQAGAIGYLLKDTPREDLYRAIRRAAQGRSSFSDDTLAQLLPQDESIGVALSEREIRILEHVAEGKTNSVIAGHLYISEATVKTHLSHIYRKLNAADRASAVAEAYKRHLQERRQRSAANRSYSAPEDVQARREAYIKLMDERKALIKKMMDEHRQAAEERRKSMLLKMNQTSTTPELAIKA